MEIQTGSRENKFYCLINPVQDVCFYLLPYRVHFIFCFRQTAFHLSHSGSEKTPVAEQRQRAPERERKAEPGGKLMFNVVRPKY